MFPSLSLSLSQTVISDLIYLFFMSSLLGRLRGPAQRRALTSLGVPCWLPIVTSDTETNPCICNPEELHPSPYDPQSDDVTRQKIQLNLTKLSSLLEAAHSCVSSQQQQWRQHRCLFLFTLINAFNPPPLSLSLSLFPFQLLSLYPSPSLSRSDVAPAFK